MKDHERKNFMKMLVVTVLITSLSLSQAVQAGKTDKVTKIAADLEKVPPAHTQYLITIN